MESVIHSTFYFQLIHIGSQKKNLYNRGVMYNNLEMNSYYFKYIADWPSVDLIISLLKFCGSRSTSLCILLLAHLDSVYSLI